MGKMQFLNHRKIIAKKWSIEFDDNEKTETIKKNQKTLSRIHHLWEEQKKLVEGHKTISEIIDLFDRKVLLLYLHLHLITIFS